VFVGVARHPDSADVTHSSGNASNDPFRYDDSASPNDV